MPVISIPTSFNIDVEFEIPGFGRRMAALFIDLCVQFCYLIIAARIMVEISKSSNPLSEDVSYDLWAMQLLLMVPVFVYYLVMEVSTNGQSPGKKLMQIRVVNINGGKPSTSQFIIRWLLRVSDTWIFIILYLMLSVMAGSRDYETLMMFAFGFGFLLTDIILVLTTKKSQRVGDILANTILIKTNSRESLDSTVFREVEENYVPMFPQVMRISDKDLNAVKTILDNGRRSNNYLAVRNATDKIKNYLQIQSDMEPEDFLDRLLKDYNYLSSK